MKIKNNFKQNSYSKEIADKYVNPTSSFILLSSEAEEMYTFENNKRVPIGSKIWVLQAGVNPFSVKLPAQVTVSANQLDQVSLVDLEAIEVRNNIYFRASSIEKIK
ncbi:hypothetical protein [Bacillus sp. TH30]|uniref:hypothetical protein n=1 Tax=Bacillus sp. TH30 TaxID=2796395 RepID=UPI0019139F41|nr:hypothetical protein [Bacillus sp. TH30]MBK5424387.1 hypothetical protein [Bacillus sp. TH30]